MSVREPGVHVEFLNHPCIHGVESKAAGREVYVDKPHVKIHVAGEGRMNEWFGPVTEQIKQRFPEEWAMFEKGAEAPRIGTPLGAWGGIGAATAKNLESIGFYTVEDLASASDMALQKVGMGARKMQEAARKFLSVSQSTADLEKLDEVREENAALKARAEEQAKQLADLAAKVAALTVEKPKGKRKTEDAQA
jgi:hypothetical protein